MYNCKNDDILKRTWAEIDLDAMAGNYRNIRAFCGDTKMMAVIKADAYGHGAEEAAELFEELGAEYLAVSNIEEAVQLKNRGISANILILGYTPPRFTAELIKNNIAQTVFDFKNASEYNAAAIAAGDRLKIHIKIDTGMSRLGFSDSGNDLTGDIRRIFGMDGLYPEGIFTHFATADDPDNSYTTVQLARFNETLAQLKNLCFPLKHTANSGASLYFPDTRLDIIRPGLILYGIYPVGGKPAGLELTAVMTLYSSVSQVRHISAGTSVSYDRTFTADRDMEIAVVPIGYADGFLRRQSKGGWLLINGKRAPIVGNICMDMCMADVTGTGTVQGDEVIVFGNGERGEMTAADAAKIAGTIPYEMCCMVSKRVTRLYFKGGNRIGRRSYIV